MHWWRRGVGPVHCAWEWSGLVSHFSTPLYTENEKLPMT